MVPRKKIRYLLAATLVAMTTMTAGPANAAAPDFQVEITWDDFMIHNPETCFTERWTGGHTRETCMKHEWIWASMSVEGYDYYGYNVRNLAKWGRKPDSIRPTNDRTNGGNPEHPMLVKEGEVHNFKDQLLCPSDTYQRCLSGQYTKNSNTLVIRGKYNYPIRFGIHIRSYDGSHDCIYAWKSRWTEAMVEYYNPSVFRHMGATVRDKSGTRRCEMWYRVVARKL